MMNPGAAEIIQHPKFLRDCLSLLKLHTGIKWLVLGSLKLNKVFFLEYMGRLGFFQMYIRRNGIIHKHFMVSFKYIVPLKV